MQRPDQTSKKTEDELGGVRSREEQMCPEPGNEAGESTGFSETIVGLAPLLPLTV